MLIGCRIFLNVTLIEKRNTLSQHKAPVSERALAQRINRVLAKQDEKLLKARGSRMVESVGIYYIVDISNNNIAIKEVDIEELGRELGALKPYEALVEDE
jgi:hypothetical protein